jgi:AraC-like DNA-binding protein/quercetin dioxygenase-like cupin family protein
MAAVAARSVKKLPKSASRGVVNMRDGTRVAAGSYVHEGESLATGWHSHPLHQLEYAIAGLVEVETATGRHLLPPHQAAWIPAGVEHQSILHASVKTVSVFFDPVLVPDQTARVRVLAVAPVLREMIGHAARWPISRQARDLPAERFFTVMADLLGESLDHELPLTLPVSVHPVMAAAASYVAHHLDTVSVPELSRATGVSERTLRRLFEAELHLSCRQYLLQARLLQGMVLLARPGQTVLQTATSVGFASSSAFARAFTQRCGESPSHYRRRVLNARPAP